MTGIFDQIELGWRFNPLEPRNARGEWTKGGQAYVKPDPARLVLDHAPKNTIFPFYKAPTDHPFFQAHPVSSENVLKVYDAASPEEKAQGMRWYADAGTLAKAIGHGDQSKGAGVLAAYSPQTPWPANMFNAARAVELGRALGPGDGMITHAMQNNAQRTLDGEPLDKVFTKNSAPKIRSFAHLIANGGDAPDDTLGNVVIDRHAMSVAMGVRLPKKESDGAPISTDRYYQHVADTYRDAAQAVNTRGREQVAPHQVQAITWLHQQAANAVEDEAGAVEHGGKGAGKGRQAMIAKAWEYWNQEAGAEGFPVNRGTTALSGSIIEQVLDMVWDGWRTEPRDSRGRWTRFGAVGSAADTMMKNREGFSVSVRTGGEPAHGYMVAQVDHTHTYPASILDDHQKLTRAIDDMLMSERSAFEGRDTYLGGWVHDGKLWLEPSDNITDQGQAVAEGQRRNQIAVWDVDNGQEIDTGGSGGGRITEHANTQDAGQYPRWILGHAGGGPAGSSQLDRGADPLGIFGQLDLASRAHDTASATAHRTASLHAKEAWRHEIRDPRTGKWVRAASDSQLDEDLKDSQVEIRLYRDNADLPDFVKNAMTWAIDNLRDGNPDMARHNLAMAISQLRVNGYDKHADNLIEFNKHIMSAQAKASSRAAKTSAQTGEKWPGEFSEKIIGLWEAEPDPDVKFDLNKASAYWDENDVEGTVQSLRRAASFLAETDDPARNARGAEYRDLASRIDMAARGTSEAHEAALSFISKAAPTVAKLVGGGQEAWDGKLDLFDGNSRPYVLAEIDWNGHMSLQQGAAEEITSVLKDPNREVEDPGAFSVPLHELIHGVIPDGTKYMDNAHAYQDYRTAQIEEGFTELGTVHHAPEYFDKMGISDRKTPFMSKRSNPAYGKAEDDLVKSVEKAAARFRDPSFPGGGSQYNEQIASRLDTAAFSLREDYPWALEDVLPIIQHHGYPESFAIAKSLSDQAEKLRKIPVADRQTMGEYAREVQDPVRVDDGNAWGHYEGPTRLAQQWVQEIAKAEGFGDLRPGTPGYKRVVALSDEINQQGAKGKVPAMVRQVARIRSPEILKDPAEFDQLVQTAQLSILEDWDYGGDDAAKIAFSHAGKVVQAKAAAIAAERAA